MALHLRFEMAFDVFGYLFHQKQINRLALAAFLADDAMMMSRFNVIRVMLHENAGIQVSHQTVARYCREVLDAGKAKKSRRPKTPMAESPATAQRELPARSPLGHPRPRGPRIADSKNL
jgi:hypothetical protein